MPEAWEAEGSEDKLRQKDADARWIKKRDELHAWHLCPLHRKEADGVPYRAHEPHIQSLPFRISESAVTCSGISLSNSGGKVLPES